MSNSITIQSPQLDATLWNEFKNEIAKVKRLLKEKPELEPSDVKTVKQLATKIKTFGDQYKREITKTANEYKQYLNVLLEQEGYAEIEVYIDRKKREQSLLVSSRMSEKIEKYSNLFDTVVTETTYLKKFQSVEAVKQNLMTHFPNISSGAADKALTDKKWQEVEELLEKECRILDELLKQYRNVLTLPYHAKTNQKIVEYAKTLDTSILLNFQQFVEEDKELMKDLLLQQMTDEKRIELITNALQSNKPTKEKLDVVQLVMKYYKG